MLTGLRITDHQRGKLAADGQLPGEILRWNFQRLGGGETGDFFCDPHTTHYTGGQHVLKGWCANIRWADQRGDERHHLGKLLVAQRQTAGEERRRAKAIAQLGALPDPDAGQRQELGRLKAGQTGARSARLARDLKIQLSEQWPDGSGRAFELLLGSKQAIQLAPSNP